MRSLTDPWNLGGVHVANRVVLAPLAGIGNWFVRLQAKRHGAGLVVSEMVSSFGLKYGDERTHREFLRIHPEEHPVAIQLFGHDPDVMREAAEIVASKGADLIDINMGCPVRKVVKTGAGSSLLDDPDKAVALARGAVEGGGGVPVTVKVRSGNLPGERTGVTLARRLVEEAGVAGIGFHPRHASQQHKGKPDYALAAELVEQLDAPVILSGGMSDDQAIVAAWEQTGADAVMIARGSFGDPWRFERLLGLRDTGPTRAEIAAELRWVIDRAEEHLGVERAGRYLRKFYPWYAEALGLTKRQQQPLVTAPTTADARAALDRLVNTESTFLAA
jgi:nifR3 family TIM-barrel protein